MKLPSPHFDDKLHVDRYYHDFLGASEAESVYAARVLRTEIVEKNSHVLSLLDFDTMYLLGGFARYVLSPPTLYTASGEIGIRGMGQDGNDGLVHLSTARSHAYEPTGPEEINTPLPTDIDIFFRDIQSFEKMRRLAKRAFPKGAEVEIPQAENRYVVVWRETAYTFTILFRRKAPSRGPSAYVSGRDEDVYDLQLVKPSETSRVMSFGNKFDILDTFDIDVCKYGMTSMGEGFRVAAIGTAQQSTNKASLLKIHNPMLALRRMIKYQNKGFYFEMDEAFRIFSAWDNYKPESRSLLMETVQGLNPRYDTSSNAVRERPHGDSFMTQDSEHNLMYGMFFGGF